MARERTSWVGILVALVVGATGVGVAVWAFGGGDDEEDLFSAFSGEAVPPDAGPPDAGAAAPSPVAKPGLPDPSLAREKYWEPSRDAGPPPDGYGTHFVRLERRLHRHFRRQLGDVIELCLDEGRKRGESFDGRLVFHVTGQPRRGLKLGFRLNGIRIVGEGEIADAGSGGELPPDVYQCIWDTVEGTEVTLPVQAAPLIAISQKPELFVDWEIREESPAGEIEPIDTGTLPPATDESPTDENATDAAQQPE